MFAIPLLALVGLATAAPAPGDAAILKSRTDMETTIERDDPAATILAYRKANFVGPLAPYNGNSCSLTYEPGDIHSIIQEAGSVCMYYQVPNCDSVKTVPTVRHDTTNGQALKWADMGEYSGKILSFKCGVDNQARRVQDEGPIEIGVIDQDATDATHTSEADEDAPTPATVDVFTEPNFGGVKTSVDAWSKCSQTFAYGTIQSLKQQQGVVCLYYRAGNCQLTNHVPVLRHDSADAAWEAADLGEWARKIQSFECQTVAP